VKAGSRSYENQRPRETNALATTRHVIGKALQQHYEQVNGAWWLFTMGKPARPLTQSEIDWHVARNHKPFVENGISEDHPDWWKDPTMTTKPTIIVAVDREHLPELAVSLPTWRKNVDDFDRCPMIVIYDDALSRDDLELAVRLTIDIDDSDFMPVAQDRRRHDPPRRPADHATRKDAHRSRVRSLAHRDADLPQARHGHDRLARGRLALAVRRLEWLAHRGPALGLHEAGKLDRHARPVGGSSRTRQRKPYPHPRRTHREKRESSVTPCWEVPRSHEQCLSLLGGLESVAGPISRHVLLVLLRVVGQEVPASLAELAPMAARGREHAETQGTRERGYAMTLRMGDSSDIVGIIHEHFNGKRDKLRGVEIGVFRGETSAALLGAFPQLYLIMVDPWETYESSHPYYKSGDGCRDKRPTATR
jgi:hypothetical protein